MIYNANLKALNLRHSKNYSLDELLKPIKSAVSRFCCNKPTPQSLSPQMA